MLESGKCLVEKFKLNLKRRMNMLGWAAEVLDCVAEEGLIGKEGY